MPEDTVLIGDVPQAAGASDRELANLLSTAAALLDVALSETKEPVAELAAIFARLGNRDDGCPVAGAPQFHHRLTERMMNVRDTLAALADVIRTHGHDSPGGNMARLRQHIRQRYGTQREPLMFDALARSATPGPVCNAPGADTTGSMASPIGLV
jgi:hypothetical protein